MVTRKDSSKQAIAKALLAQFNRAPRIKLKIKEPGRTGKPSLSVGFDYKQTVKELWDYGLGYQDIADYCGISRGKNVKAIISHNVIPSHPQGEALYALYRAVTGKGKPPLKPGQGLPEVDDILHKDIEARRDRQLEWRGRNKRYASATGTV